MLLTKRDHTDNQNSVFCVQQEFGLIVFYIYLKVKYKSNSSSSNKAFQQKVVSEETTLRWHIRMQSELEVFVRCDCFRGTGTPLITLLIKIHTVLHFLGFPKESTNKGIVTF